MDQPKKSLLIIFYRNPEPGKVKTRLAATLGNEKALEVFVKLSLHIRDITQNLDVDKMVFYSDILQKGDIWTDSQYFKALQHGDDLGIRMESAFAEGFNAGYSSICIIGTDCFELTKEVVARGVESLQSVDAVIGPARDGGYYLLGMNKLHREVFRKKQWSTETVFRNTIADFDFLGLKYIALPVLSDVDIEEDLPPELR